MKIEEAEEMGDPTWSEQEFADHAEAIFQGLVLFNGKARLFHPGESHLGEQKDAFNGDNIKRAYMEIPRVFGKRKKRSQSSTYGLKHHLERIRRTRFADTYGMFPGGTYIKEADFAAALLMRGYAFTYTRRKNGLYPHIKTPKPETD